MGESLAKRLSEIERLSRAGADEHDAARTSAILKTLMADPQAFDLATRLADRLDVLKKQEANREPQ